MNMAAAVVDININEHETFEMTLAYWDNEDRTLPLDLTGWTFDGAFNFGSLCIPMSFTVNDNEVLVRVEADALVNLPHKGTYSIEASNAGDVYRLQQGKVRVDKEVVCS